MVESLLRSSVLDYTAIELRESLDHCGDSTVMNMTKRSNFYEEGTIILASLMLRQEAQNWSNF